MKSSSVLWKMAISIVLTLILGPINGFTQVPGRVERKGAGSLLRLHQLTGTGGRAVMKSPDIARGSTRRGDSREWAEIGVQFDTEPEWIDELTLNFFVLLRSSDKADLTLIKGSVTYLDVARGASHMGGAYVRPAALARYGKVIGVAVEAVVKGETVDSLSEGKLAPSKPLPKEWWKNAKLVPKDGYVLDKAKTPFILVNYDDYEAMK